MDPLYNLSISLSMYFDVSSFTPCGLFLYNFLDQSISK